MGIKYWNDIELEKTKPYWIENDSDPKLINFLKEDTNILRCFEDSLSYCNEFLGGVKGNVLDVGSGVAWSSAVISRIKDVASITANDYSEHRLTKVAPFVFNQMGGDKSKFHTLIGDFMEIEFPDESYDVILFCQSLYMYQDLDSVLQKVYRMLVKGGFIMVVCERIIPEYSLLSARHYLRKLLRLLKGRSDSSGRCFYADSDYRKAIEKAGFDYKFQILDYPIFPSNNSLNAGNHFGLKGTFK
jgi:ubiquinone/menaquinone biosynthesis C-methylase UbiE